MKNSPLRVVVLNKSACFESHAVFGIFQGTMMVAWPGFVMVMTPLQRQLSMDVLLSAGKLLTSTVGEPGIQGATVFGTQGAGVKNTGGGLFVAGFVGLLHIPKGGIFTVGLKSMIVAISMDVFTVPAGIVRLEGATPNVHIIIAPPHTQMAIVSNLLSQAEN